MKLYGRSSVCEFIGDRIVYRNLVPYDPRLPALEAISKQIHLPAGVVPRKSEPAYARVIAFLLRQARALDLPGKTVRRVAFIGDTRLLDATAFSNICQVGDWPGLAFIGAEDQAMPKVETVSITASQLLYLSNRWGFLAAEAGDPGGFPSFPEFCDQQRFPVDEHTALLIDLDKTAIGARGRNAQVIDRARLQAVHDTVADLLGGSFDEATFRTAYDQLNQPEFHPFTADNQDYLAYICLVLGSGLYGLDWLLEETRSSRLRTFQQFISLVEGRKTALPTSLRALHDEIFTYVQIGDPTPFKAFRYNEYLATVGRMGCLDDSTPVGTLLAEEIVITQEVRELALAWQGRGALVFGLSDKPDEASIPTPERAALGYLPGYPPGYPPGLPPLHRAETHVVGD